MSYVPAHASEHRRLKRLALQEQLRALEEEEQSRYRYPPTSSFPSMTASSSSHHYPPVDDSSHQQAPVEPLHRPTPPDYRSFRLTPSYQTNQVTNTASWQTHSQSTGSSSSRDRYPNINVSPTSRLRQFTSAGRPQPVPSESQVHSYLLAHVNQPDGLYAGWVIQGHRFDVYRLFTLVVQMGGSSQVTARDAWPVVAAALDFAYNHGPDVPRSSATIGLELKEFFANLLGNLEILWDRTKEGEDWEQQRSRQPSTSYEVSPNGMHTNLSSHSPVPVQPQPRASLPSWNTGNSQPTPPPSTRVSNAVPAPTTNSINDRTHNRPTESRSSSKNSEYQSRAPANSAGVEYNSTTASLQYSSVSSSQPISQSSHGTIGTVSAPAEYVKPSDLKQKPVPKKSTTSSRLPAPSVPRPTSSTSYTQPAVHSQAQTQTAAPRSSNQQQAARPPTLSRPQSPRRIEVVSNVKSTSTTDSTSTHPTAQSVIAQTHYIPPAVASFDDLVTSDILPFPPFGTSFSLPPFPSRKLEYAWRAHELRSSIRKMSAGGTHRHISHDEILWWNKLVLLLQKNSGVVIPKPPVSATGSRHSPRPATSTTNVSTMTEESDAPSQNGGPAPSDQVLVNASQTPVLDPSIPPKKKRGRPRKDRASLITPTEWTPTYGTLPGDPDITIRHDVYQAQGTLTESEAAAPAPGPTRKIRSDKGGSHKKRAIGDVQDLANPLPRRSVLVEESNDAQSPTPAADFLKMVYARQNADPDSSAEPPELFPLIHSHEQLVETGPSRLLPRPHGGFSGPGAAAAAARARWGSGGTSGSNVTPSRPANTPKSSPLVRPSENASPRTILHLSGNKVSAARITERDAKTPTKIYVPLKPKKRPRKSDKAAIPQSGPTNGASAGRFADLASSEEPSTLAEALGGLDTAEVFPDIFQLSQIDLRGVTPFTQPLPEPLPPPPGSLSEMEFDMPDSDISDLPLPMDFNSISTSQSKGLAKRKGRNDAEEHTARESGEPPHRKFPQVTVKSRSSTAQPTPSRATRTPQPSTSTDLLPRSTRSSAPLSLPPLMSKVARAVHAPRISSPLAIAAQRQRRGDSVTQMGRRKGSRITSSLLTRASSKMSSSALRSRASLSVEMATRSGPLTSAKRLRNHKVVSSPQPRTATSATRFPKGGRVERSPSIVAIADPRKVPVVEINASPASGVRQITLRRKGKRGPPVVRMVVSLPIDPRWRRTLIRRGHYDSFRDDDSDDEFAKLRRAHVLLRPLRPLPRGSMARSARPRSPEAIPLRFLTRPGPEVEGIFKAVLDEKDFNKRTTEHVCGWKGCDAILASEDHLARHVALRCHTKQASFQAGVYGTDVLWRCHWQGCEEPCFQTEAELSQHVTARHISRTLACPFLDCDLTSPTISHLTRHVTKTHDSPDDEPRPLADLSQHLPPPFPIPDQVIPALARTDELTTPSVRGSVHVNKFRQQTVIGKVATLCFMGPDPVIHVEHPPHMLDAEEPLDGISGEEEKEVWYTADEVDELNQEAILRGRKRRWEVVVEIPTRRRKRMADQSTVFDEDNHMLIQAIELLLPSDKYDRSAANTFTYPDSLYQLYPPPPASRSRTRGDRLVPKASAPGYPDSIYNIYPRNDPAPDDIVVDDEESLVSPETPQNAEPGEEEEENGSDNLFDDVNEFEDEDAAEIADFFATHSPGAPTPWQEPVEPLDHDDAEDMDVDTNQNGVVPTVIEQSPLSEPGHVAKI